MPHIKNAQFEVILTVIYELVVSGTIISALIVYLIRKVGKRSDDSLNIKENCSTLRRVGSLPMLVRMGRIYKGYGIRIEKAPYQVNYGDICGGVLVHKQWALTTAHCGIDKDFIRVGSRRRLGGTKVNVSGHLVHPKYGKKHKFDFDVLLLQLRRRLHFSERISMIPFSREECGDAVTVTGWGYPAEKGDYQDILQQVRVNVVPIEECQVVDQFWYNHTLTSRMFCAGGEDGDACQGDSGGAAVSFGRLVGLSSFGYGCGRNIPGVYTNLSAPSIKTWIKRYVPLDVQ